MTDKERIGFISDFVLAFLFGVLPFPVIVKWIGWILCWLGLIYILQAVVNPINRLPQKTRMMAVLVLGIAFILVFRPLANSMWRTEQAALPEGDLVGAGPAIADGKQHGFPMLQIGGTTMIMLPSGVPERFTLFPDANIRVEWGYKGPLFTTTVRDRNGNLVVEVSRNHWHVYPLYSADKNYTKDALEVRDSAGHVVLQVRILPDRVQLQGEWWDTQGSGIRFLQPPVITPEMGSIVLPLGPRAQHNESLIQSMFQYPSKDHWREFAQ